MVTVNFWVAAVQISKLKLSDLCKKLLLRGNELFIDFIDIPLKGLFSDKNTYTYQLITINYTLDPKFI
jgi:hypothetical protein